jgi:hypothetical protein
MYVEATRKRALTLKNAQMAMKQKGLSLEAVALVPVEPEEEVEEEPKEEALMPMNPFQGQEV